MHCFKRNSLYTGYVLVASSCCVCVCEAAWLVCCSGNLTHISVEGELHNGQGGGVARLGKVWGGLLEVGQYV